MEATVGHRVNKILDSPRKKAIGCGQGGSVIWRNASNGQRCTAPVEWYPADAVVELTLWGWRWSIRVDGSVCMGGTAQTMGDGRDTCEMVADWEIRDRTARAAGA